MTAATLRSHTAKDLAQLARQNGIAGWHSMRKEELISALIKLARKNGVNTLSVVSSTEFPAVKNDKKSSSSRRKIDQLKHKLHQAKNISSHPSKQTSTTPKVDRLVVMVRDPYWLHAFWELTPRSVDRAQAALGHYWHTAKPTLRVYYIKDSTTETLYKDIFIHGGVSNWYVDVNDPPAQFRMEIGYLTENNNFYCLARSNSVQTPSASTSDAVDENWSDVAENADRIFAMSGGYSPQGTSRELQELLEERLNRPLGTPMKTRFGKGAAEFEVTEATLPLAVDAEIVIYGATERDAHVTLKGEPVNIRPDGTFTVRLDLPDARQVLPIVASSRDGVEQRTIIMAVERNTKTMESIVRDVNKK